MFHFFSILPENILFNVFLSVIVAFSLTFIIIPQIISISRLKKLFEYQDANKISRLAIPTLGGIAITIGTIITFFTTCPNISNAEINRVIGISFVIIIIGLIDDLIVISWRQKLGVQFIVFIYLTVIINLRIINLDGIFGIYNLTNIQSILFSFVFFIAVINSINLIDGIDGLFGSISLFISLVFAFLFLGSEYQSYSFLNFALSGSLIAYLIYNILGKKNKIFAGETGTYFVGFILAISSIKASNVGIVYSYTILSLFALPFFDAFRVLSARTFKGIEPFSPDSNHIYHLLIKSGLSHIQATFVCVLFSLICFVSLKILSVDIHLQIMILILLYLIFYLITKHLSSLQYIKKNMVMQYIPISKLDLSELYISLGLKNNPFSRFSAEEERDYLDDVYYSPKYFQPLFSDIKNGLTRFIFGARGVGKTALLIKLKKQLDRDNVFSIIIDDYEGIPVENNCRAYLENTIRKIVTGYCYSVINSPILLKRLKKSEKEKLTFFIENFFSPITNKEFEKYVNITSNYKSKNYWIRALNYILKPFNSVLSVGIEIGGDFVKKSLGLESFNTTMVYKDYVKEVKEYIPNKSLLLDTITYSILKDILCDLSKIIKKSGFSQVVIMYDKIDENKHLGGEIFKIVEFMHEILQDTNLLLNENFGLVFSLWSELKNDLSKNGVRFDKICPTDVTWNNNELESIINERLKYLSSKPLVIIKLDEILSDSRYVEEVISISNKSPRDLLRLISCIYYEQANIDNRAIYFSVQAIKKGILKFISDYNYYSILSQKGNKEDILKDIQNILLSGKLTFKIVEISQDLKISLQSTNNLMKNLLKHGVIKELNQVQVNSKLFEIIDPKIVWLIKNQINPWQTF